MGELNRTKWEAEERTLVKLGMSRRGQEAAELGMLLFVPGAFAEGCAQETLWK